MSILDVKDRIPTNVLDNKAVRYGVYDESGNLLRYEYIKREDEPVEEGTPVNRQLFRNLQGDLYTQDRYNMSEVILGKAEQINYNNPIPMSGWEEETPYTKYSKDGYEISSSGYQASTIASTWSVTNVFDGNDDTFINPPSGTDYNYVTIKFPHAIKILTLRIYITYPSGTWYIQGSNNGEEFEDLYSSATSGDITIKLNSSKYLYYRVKAHAESNSTWRLHTFEIQTWYGLNEVYVHNLSLPLTSYEKGKIINIEAGRIVNPNYKIHNDDIIPKTWTAITTGTKYSSENGVILTANSSYSNSYVFNACDGTENSGWAGRMSDNSNPLKLTFPEAVKINKFKIKAYADNGLDYSPKMIVKGSNDDSDWITLNEYYICDSSLVEIQVDNAEYYKYYSFSVETTTTGELFYIYEIQVSEWEDDASEISYIENFDVAYLDINGLGPKLINGSMNYGEKYRLIYNGENWDIDNGLIRTIEFNNVYELIVDGLNIQDIDEYDFVLDTYRSTMVSMTINDVTTYSEGDEYGGKSSSTKAWWYLVKGSYANGRTDFKVGVLHGIGIFEARTIDTASSGRNWMTWGGSGIVPENAIHRIKFIFGNPNTPALSIGTLKIYRRH